MCSFAFGRPIHAMMLCTIPQAINFFAYDLYSRAFLKMAQSNGPGQVERFAAGACAGRKEDRNNED